MSAAIGVREQALKDLDARQASVRPVRDWWADELIEDPNDPRLLPLKACKPLSSAANRRWAGRRDG